MPTAAILAGGRAARFGGRDPRAPVIEGRSILERQITALLSVTDALGDRHCLLAHVNTPADYEEFEGLLGH